MVHIYIDIHIYIVIKAERWVPLTTCKIYVIGQEWKRRSKDRIFAIRHYQRTSEANYYCHWSKTVSGGVIYAKFYN
jgi:hypothetical protein